MMSGYQLRTDMENSYIHTYRTLLNKQLDDAVSWPR